MPTPTLADRLALDRTRLAKVRTLLAHLRTALGFAAAGATLWRLFPAEVRRYRALEAHLPPS